MSHCLSKYHFKEFCGFQRVYIIFIKYWFLEALAQCCCKYTYKCIDKTFSDEWNFPAFNDHILKWIEHISKLILFQNTLNDKRAISGTFKDKNH